VPPVRVAPETVPLEPEPATRVKALPAGPAVSCTTFSWAAPAV
jgi:hypothetical protein